MCSPLNCGTSHFPSEEDSYGIEELLSPINKDSKKHTKKIKDSENPFTNRGLDKFNALLDELERKKQQIYTQKGSQDISFIRFAYSSSGEWRPIVVKTKNKIKWDDEHRLHRMQSNAADKDHVVKAINHGALKHVDDHHEKTKVGKMTSEGPHKESGSIRSWEVVMLEKLSQPSCYVPVMFVLIMLFLIVFGRTFTILCTSIGWYLIPIIKDKSSSSSSKSSKDGTKKMKKVYSVITKESGSSPYSVLSGPLDKLHTPKHAHRKSW